MSTHPFCYFYFQEIECLKEGKSELGLQVARMNQLVTAGQEALQQEQKTADLLREQLAKVRIEVCHKHIDGPVIRVKFLPK